MRLAQRGTGDSRQDRTERLRRDRASASAVRSVFPAVQMFGIELKFEGSANPPASQSHLLHPPAPAFFKFPCPYADCNGHFDLDSAVRAAVADPAHRVKGMLECTGARSRDHASRQPCQLHLHYIITVTLQADS